MAAAEVVVQGAVTVEGQLILDQQPDLPPGRVEVTVRALQSEAAEEHPMFQALRRIWADMDARGFAGGRSLEEAVADVRALRDEWDAHQEALEARQERLRAPREPGLRPGDPRE
ncbi:MAG: hypothetical protein FJX74_13705 [Armatimonadetes bacterium]|nr:hypothetical protein [Armatimonadota bacterium]